MATFHDLPDEIILLILEAYLVLFSEPAFPAWWLLRLLPRVSRRWTQLATPCLYRDIHLNVHGGRFDAFLRTVSSRQHLARHVLGFRWTGMTVRSGRRRAIDPMDDQRSPYDQAAIDRAATAAGVSSTTFTERLNERNPDARLALMLHLFPNLRSLHLNKSLHWFPLFRQTLGISLKSRDHTTPLIPLPESLRSLCEVTFSSRCHEQRHLFMDIALAMLSLPRIKKLNGQSFERNRSGRPTLELASFYGSSTVQELHLCGPWIDSSTIAELLRIPVALRVLTMSWACPSAMTGHMPGPDAKALGYTRHSLTRLRLFGPWCPGPYQGTGIGSLQDFSKLERIETTISRLTGPESGGVGPHGLGDLLPPSVQHLGLQASPEDDRDGQRLLEHVWPTIHHAATKLPRLRRLVLHFYSLAHLNGREPILKTISEMKSACAMVNIEMGYTEYKGKRSSQRTW